MHGGAHLRVKVGGEVLLFYQDALDLFQFFKDLYRQELCTTQGTVHVPE